VRAGRQRQDQRRLAAPAEILAVDEDGGAAGALRTSSRATRGASSASAPRRPPIFRRGGGDEVAVVAVGLVVALEGLERAGDVEDDVAVGDQPVRGEELEQRLVVRRCL
jgi:hypothetical protein